MKVEWIETNMRVDDFIDSIHLEGDEEKCVLLKMTYRLNSSWKPVSTKKLLKIFNSVKGKKTGVIDSQSPEIFLEHYIVSAYCILDE